MAENTSTTLWTKDAKGFAGSIGIGRPITSSTLVKSGQEREYLHQYDYESIPNLVEMQLQSYQWFLDTGLSELFDGYKKIRDDAINNLSLEFLDYTLGEPKHSPDECRERDLTYEMPLKVKVRLVRVEPNEVKESEVYLGEVPCMTKRGTFIINGAERVVVAQLSRSPGAYFKEEISYSGRRLLQMQIIPQEGAWMEAEVTEESTKEAPIALGVRIGQSKRMPVTTLLRAFSSIDEAHPNAQGTEALSPRSPQLEGRIVSETVVDDETGEILADRGTKIEGEIYEKIRAAHVSSAIEVEVPRTQCSTTRQILDLFATKKTLGESEINEEFLAEKSGGEETYPYFLVNDLVDPATEKVVLQKLTHLGPVAIEKIAQVQPQKLEVYDCPLILAGALVLDKVRDEKNPNEEPFAVEQLALAEVHKMLRPGDPPTQEQARSLLRSFFCEPTRYDLGRVGRYKLNGKLEVDVPEDKHTLTIDDLIGGIHYLIKMEEGTDDKYNPDDIDHLRNKRVRAVGELLQNHLRQAMQKVERVAKERLASTDPEQVTAQSVISIKPITAAVRAFFGSGQLSQFMEQTNPLAELVHKRRISVLGPGGLSRQSAKLEVRDVHHSHYGRVCPIETPEGPNIGLINSLATFSRIDEFGFLQAPYRVVKDCKLTEEIQYLSADEEEGVVIAAASTLVDKKYMIAEDMVQARRGPSHPLVPKEQVQYMDISPLQVFSVPTVMIPFLENDDANRALMGANMQRQAVPLVRPQVPLVKTGIERRAAHDSASAVFSDVDGEVTDVTARSITIASHDGEEISYPLRTFVRSNQATCIHQKPIVYKGQKVRAGDPIADGTSTANGELSLGVNMTVAFSLWDGYNYEDAIILSERVSKQDMLTSIHIEKHEIEARDTKLGPEEVTRDIPNVGEDQLKNLDDNGVVRVGAEVFPQDILVGKIAPKSQGELSPEERLVIAIFGRKAEESRDASLRMPHGEKGTVVGVQTFSRYKYFSPQYYTKLLEEGYLDDEAKRAAEFTFVNDLDQLVCPVTGGPLDRVQGDDLRAGTNQMVRVFVAQKRKIMEGDKMAGRHGNKGVVSKILPEADMPFLADGTPVDIILNPLGVPSRMNIGQVLEMHLGLIGKHFGTSFINPVFAGAREPELYQGMAEVAEELRMLTLRNYIDSETEVEVDEAKSFDELISNFTQALVKLDDEKLNALGEQLNTDPEEFERSDRNHKADIISKIVYDISIARSGFDPQKGKCTLYDGRTGEPMMQPVAVGQVYMMKLHHLVEDKIHARSTGPYSLVTQQPLGGKAQFGGQRFGEMEVWALEAYGAANILQEVLTIKSDDVSGRVKTYESLVKGESGLEPGVPESFKILVKEMQSLALQVEVEDEDGKVMEIKEVEEEFEK